MIVEFHGFEVPTSAVVLGAILGTTYGLLAVGLVLVYRSSRIINFAHSQIGAFGAAVFAVAVSGWGIPYWAALPGAVAVAAATGGATEALVIRRLRRAPSLMTIVATLGVGEILLALSDIVSKSVQRDVFPTPPRVPGFRVGALNVTPSYTAILLAAPVVVVALMWFFRRTRLGLAVRGAAVNADGARMIGVSAARMATVAWALAGALSGLTAVLVMPTRGFISTATLGPDLLLRALVAVVIARMERLWVALAAGVGVGVVEQVLLWNNPNGSTVQAVLTAVILVVLLLQRRSGGRRRPSGGWTLLRPWPPLTLAQQRNPLARALGWITGIAAVATALVATTLVTNSAALTLVAIAAFALVGLSLTVITGLGGELSLGQFALAGIGAVAGVHVLSAGGDIWLALLAAGCAAAAASLIVGLPALRIRGLMLSVTTLGLALASQAWLFQQSWAFGFGAITRPVSIFAWSLTTPKRYMAFAVLILSLGVLLTHNLRRSGFGRRLVAIRDNEDAARAFGLPAARVKLQAFAVSGFLAGVGGVLYAQSLSYVSSGSFPVASGIDVVTMTVLGGIATVAGPIVGALYIVGIPRFVPLGSAGLAATAFGWLILILYVPGGLTQLVAPLRAAVLRVVTRGAGSTQTSDEAAERAHETALRAQPRRTVAPADPAIATSLLEVRGVSKRYGGLQAVDEVNLDVHRGETVGLIGPNGAGKTTLFELISGFIRHDAGSIVFDGREIGSLSPEKRARLGLVRSFQDAALFETMTVESVVRVACERAHPTRLLLSVVAVESRERQQAARAAELLEIMGLTRFRSSPINELSTGTRRIVDLACMVALEPTLLLLDEPSAGIAQREVEQLIDVLDGVRRYLSAAMVVIDHDIQLVSSLASRMIALESGRVIAAGTPAEVCAHPAVIESYLGGDQRAVRRSGGFLGVASPASRIEAAT